MPPLDGADAPTQRVGGSGVVGRDLTAVPLVRVAGVLAPVLAALVGRRVGEYVAEDLGSPPPGSPVSPVSARSISRTSRRASPRSGSRVVAHPRLAHAGVSLGRTTSNHDASKTSRMGFHPVCVMNFSELTRMDLVNGSARVPASRRRNRPTYAASSRPTASA